MEQWKTGKRLARLGLTAAGTLIICIFLFHLNITVPMMVLVSLMLFLTVLAGRAEGALCGILSAGYACFFFSTYYQNLIQYTYQNKLNILVILVSLFLDFVLACMVRQKQHAAQRLQAIKRLHLQEITRKWKKQAEQDNLTGLYNRWGGDNQMKEYFINHPGKPAVLAEMDIDNFKHFNDMFGHEVGDTVLRDLANRIKNHFGPEIIPIRNGGDEFQLFFPGRSQEDVQSQLESFIQKEFQVTTNNLILKYQVSMGYAMAPEQASSVSELCRKADIALYHVKENGKNGIAAYHPCMGNEGRSRYGFSLLDLSAGLPVSVLIYRADPGEEILFGTTHLFHLFDCKNMEEFMGYTGGTFRNMVHPDDVQEVEESIARQIQENSQQIDYVAYRIITKTGRIRQVYDIGRRVHNPYYGDIFYVVLYEKQEQTQPPDLFEQTVIQKGKD